MPLIQSTRFKNGDLDHWQRLELMDKLYAQQKSKRLQILEKKALEAIAKFISTGSAYCSVSWGKDSVVIAYLCSQFNIPLVHVYDKVTYNPCSFDVAKHFKSAINLETEYLPHARGDGTHNAFFKPANDKFGDRSIIGLRKSESATRLVSRGVHGISTANRCRPIIDWTDQDVFAYLALKDLPINSVYAMSMGGAIPREHLRTDVIGDFNGRGKGRTDWELQYFPDRHEAIARGYIR